MTYNLTAGKSDIVHQRNSGNNSVAAQAGFTLLELIVTMSIAAILATMALPAFNNTLANGRLTSNANLLVGAINYARSEAINLGVEVVAQGKGSGGWEVVRADDGSQLRTFDPPSKDLTLTSSVASIRFAADGYRVRESGLSAATLTLCDSRGLGREVTVSVGGSMSVKELSSC